MNLQYVPLLHKQRELQVLPRNYERFKQYLRTLVSHDGTIELPPLGIMNPMAKNHVTVLLDALLAMDADGIANDAMKSVTDRFATEPGDYKVGLVLADDLMGGWTNRYDYEFKIRFGAGFGAPGRALPKWLKSAWLTAVLWSSEPASAQAVREAILTTVYRTSFVQQNGPARTLRDMLVQEGHVLAAAGCAGPRLDEGDMAYTREVLAPYLEEADKRTCMECLFGDEPGRTLGFTPRGLSPWAGIALALHDFGSIMHV
jgi:hypothetical protein